MNKKIFIAIYFVFNTLFFITFGIQSEINQDSLDFINILTFFIISNLIIGLIIILLIQIYNNKSKVAELKAIDYKSIIKSLKRPENIIKTSLIFGIILVSMGGIYFLNDQYDSQDQPINLSDCKPINLTYYSGISCLLFKNPNNWVLDVNIEEKYPQTIVNKTFLKIIAFDFTNRSAIQSIPLETTSWEITGNSFSQSLEILKTDSNYPNSYEIRTIVRFESTLLDGSVDFQELSLKNNFNKKFQIINEFFILLFVLIILVLIMIFFYVLYTTYNLNYVLLSFLSTVQYKIASFNQYIREKISQILNSVRTPYSTTKKFAKPRSLSKRFKDYRPGNYYQLSQELIPLEKKMTESQSDSSLLDQEIDQINNFLLPLSKNNELNKQFSLLKENFLILLKQINKFSTETINNLCEKKLVEKIRQINTNKKIRVFDEISNFNLLLTYLFFISQEKNIWRNAIGPFLLINEVNWNTNQENDFSSFLNLQSFVADRINKVGSNTQIIRDITFFHHIEENLSPLLNMILRIPIKSFTNKNLKKLVKNIRKQNSVKAQSFFYYLNNYKLLITYSFFALHKLNTWERRTGMNLLVIDYEWNNNPEMDMNSILDLLSFIQDQIIFLNSIPRQQSQTINAKTFLNNINVGELRLSKLNKQKKSLKENYNKIKKDHEQVSYQISHIKRNLDMTNSITGNKYRIDYIKMGKERISKLKKYPSKNKEKIEQILLEIQYFESSDQR